MRPIFRTAVSVLVVALGAASVERLIPSEPAGAQIKTGEFRLSQPGASGPVGWVYSNGSGTREWWAYIDGVYEWADVGNTPGNPWNLAAERIGNPTWATYAAWKADVLSRPATEGKKVIFQDHSVTEESVQN